MVIIVSMYFEYSNQYNQMLQILRILKYNNKEIIELLLMTEKEDQITNFIMENKSLSRYLDPKRIIDLKLYSLMIVFG